MKFNLDRLVKEDIQEVTSLVFNHFKALDFSDEVQDSELKIGKFLHKNLDNCFYFSFKDKKIFIFTKILDVSFMIKGSGLVLMIPLVVTKNLIASDLKEILNLLLEHFKNIKIQSVVVNFLNSEYKNINLFLANKFELFSPRYYLSFCKILKEKDSEQVFKKLSSKDLDIIADKIDLVRKKREDIKPHFWQIRDDARKNHIPFLESEITQNHKFSYGLYNEDNSLNTFAIGKPKDLTFPDEPNLGLLFKKIEKVILVDDFYSIKDSDLNANMSCLLTKIAKKSSKLGFTGFVFVTSQFDDEIQEYLNNIGSIKLNTWYAKALFS